MDALTVLAIAASVIALIMTAVFAAIGFNIVKLLKVLRDKLDRWK